MQKQTTKEDLLNMVLEQIKTDVHVGDYEAIQELLNFIPTENLIAYLPEEDWKPFKHLVAKDYLEKEKKEIL